MDSEEKHNKKKPFHHKIKNLVIGKAHNIWDPAIFHKLSLIAIFAWIGLGADALSSSSYGPQEAFLSLGKYHYLSVFIALMVSITIFVISASYSQIIELFPNGGGGYIVASKLLSPMTGMISGCALLIDYVLTITVSIASGADAVFSFLPLDWYPYRLLFAVGAIILLIFLNLRGAKESIFTFFPIFMIFIISHLFAIIFAIVKHTTEIPALAYATRSDIHSALGNLGYFGLIFLLLHAFSMGAGTFTGIEAVSNATGLLREPKVKTAKKTMKYMTWSLVFMVVGLMGCYMLYGVQHQPGKTLNAVLFESISQGWNHSVAKWFILIILISEAALLFVASQTGFLDGPRVLASMAADGWVPKRFAALSDRLVIQNGIILMGGAALLLMILTGGSVKFLVVLYSITVFITFVLSQLGVFLYWLKNRVEHRKKKIFITGIGLLVSAFILISVTIVKFYEGGWITILILIILITLMLLIKYHYDKTKSRIQKLDHLVGQSENPKSELPIIFNEERSDEYVHPFEKTAVVLVNGFNGVGIKTLFNIFNLFGKSFKNFIFLEIGVLETAAMKSHEEIQKLGTEVKSEAEKYVHMVNRYGYYGESITAVSIDVVHEVLKITPKIIARFPNSVFFAGQLVFAEEEWYTKVLHNYTVFALQENLYRKGTPFIILPINV